MGNSTGTEYPSRREAISMPISELAAATKVRERDSIEVPIYLDNPTLDTTGTPVERSVLAAVKLPAAAFSISLRVSASGSASKSRRSEISSIRAVISLAR